MSHKELALGLEKIEDRLMTYLLTKESVTKFKNTVLMAASRNPYLYKLDQISLLKSCQLAAADGLVPDGREAALVPFGKQVQYLPMYQGLIKKVRNTGELSTIYCDVVYEGDQFDYYINETGQKFYHQPDYMNEDRGEMKLAYAIATFKDGSRQIEVLDKNRIEKARKSSKASGGESSPWNLWTAEMWKKTALRAICKYLPQSVDLDRVFSAEDKSFDGAIDITPPKAPEKTLGGKKQSKLADLMDEPEETAQEHQSDDLFDDLPEELA